MFSQPVSKESVVEAGSFQLFCIFLVTFVYCEDEPEGSCTYHTIDVLLRVQELSSILNGEVLIAHADSYSMGEDLLGSAQ